MNIRIFFCGRELRHHELAASIGTGPIHFVLCPDGPLSRGSSVEFGPGGVLAYYGLQAEHAEDQDAWVRTFPMLVLSNYPSPSPPPPLLSPAGEGLRSWAAVADTYKLSASSISHHRPIVAVQIDALDPCALLMVIFAAVLGGFWLTFLVYRAVPIHHASPAVARLTLYPMHAYSSTCSLVFLHW